MSLPNPSTKMHGNSGITIDPQELEAMDAPLVALASRSGGDLRKLLYAFFSFLHRRTDFYLVPHDDDLKAGKTKMGFREGDAEKLLLAAFRQFPLRKMPSQSEMAARKQADAHKKGLDSSKATTHTSSKSAEKPMDDEKITTETKKANAAAPSGGAERENTVRLTEEGLQVPVGNGGSTDRYKWTQTIDECSVLVGIPKGFRGKDLDVSIKSSFVSVRSKKPLPAEDDVHVFLEGELTQKIVPGESTWSLEGGVLVLILYKKTKTFWETVVDGDDKIDTSLVDSTRRIDEYDESTQAQLRKVIFDQSQSRRGLPTSDEILGKKPNLPPLPSGVEYIDQQKLDEVAPKTSKPT